MTRFFWFFVIFAITTLATVVRANQVHRECRKEGMIAFTFDQGPSLYTGILLTALSQANVKATFHVVPDYLDNPVLSANLRRAALEGHLIGIFVRDGIEDSSIKNYLANATSILKQYVNYTPQWLRFPAPGPSPALLKTVTGLGYRVSGYNLDSQDYQYASDPVEDGGKGPIFRTFRDTLDLIVPPTLGSFIVVQRDIVQTSVLQTAAILKYAKERGYKGVRMDECIGVGTVISGSGDNEGKGEYTPPGEGFGGQKENDSLPLISQLGWMLKLTTILIIITIIAI